MIALSYDAFSSFFSFFYSSFDATHIILTIAHALISKIRTALCTALPMHTYIRKGNKITNGIVLNFVANLDYLK